ncbi:sigma-70 family RNA polymerase sigma factor, partial [Fusicatenibacter saccharivorans]|nr:sigma-70 family RNA polymerase sigma factor [Fusicatenibacter saccharivorans]
MELSSSDKERIQHQYDSLAKKTLVGESKSHRRTFEKRAARQVTFSDLS